MVAVAKRAKPRRTTWAVADLGDHPRQYANFGEPSAAEVDALVRSIKKKRLQHPIEILPDGTVVAGHCRLRAVRRLGWETVPVIVRYDLAAAGDVAAEEYLIEDNLLRRHLTMMGKAKCVARLVELEEGRAVGPLARQTLRNKVGARLGLSDKSVSRYMLLSKAPSPLQRAFDAGAVTLVQGCRAACLPPPAMKKLVAALQQEDGRSAGDKIREAIGDRGPDSPHQAFVRLLAAMRREIPKFLGRAEEIAPGRRKKSRQFVNWATHEVWRAVC